MNLILIGYRASGKTSVGKRLSDLLQRPFCDTDALIRQQTGKTVKEIVLEGGWPAFREAEKAVIAGLASQEGAVIALGGGAVLDLANVEVLKPRGLFIWLQADQETVQDRLSGDRASAEQRPPLSLPGNGHDGEVLSQRIPIYRALADLVIDTAGRSIEAVADEIVAALKTGRGTGPVCSGLSAGETGGEIIGEVPIEPFGNHIELPGE
jgi:shikimate kinase